MLEKFLLILQVRAILKKLLDASAVEVLIEGFLEGIQEEDQKEKIRSRLLKNKSFVELIMFGSYAQVFIGMMTKWEVNWAHEHFLKEHLMPPRYSERFAMLCEMATALTCYRLVNTVLLGIRIMKRPEATA